MDRIHLILAGLFCTALLLCIPLAVAQPEPHTAKVTTNKEVAPSSGGNIYICTNITSRVPDIGTINLTSVRVYCAGHLPCNGAWTSNINDWKAGEASLDFPVDSFWKQGYLNDCVKVKYSQLPSIAYVELFMTVAPEQEREYCRIRGTPCQASEILDMVTIYGDTAKQAERDAYYQKIKQWGLGPGGLNECRGDTWRTDSAPL